MTYTITESDMITESDELYNDFDNYLRSLDYPESDACSPMHEIDSDMRCVTEPTCAECLFFDECEQCKPAPKPVFPCTKCGMEVSSHTTVTCRKGCNEGAAFILCIECQESTFVFRQGGELTRNCAMCGDIMCKETLDTTFGFMIENDIDLLTLPAPHKGETFYLHKDKHGYKYFFVFARKDGKSLGEYVMDNGHVRKKTDADDDEDDDMSDCYLSDNETCEK